MPFPLLDVFTAVSENIGSSALIAGSRALWRRASGAQIAITSPVIGGTLEGEHQLDQETFYEVRGTLRRLPKDHRIWLITQNVNRHEFYPQGKRPVIYNPTTREWVGIVSRNRHNPVVHAVVAPPSASDFFMFYHTVGLKTKFAYTLHHIPDICVNKISIQTQYPPNGNKV